MEELIPLLLFGSAGIALVFYVLVGLGLVPRPAGDQPAGGSLGTRPDRGSLGMTG